MAHHAQRSGWAGAAAVALIVTVSPSATAGSNDYVALGDSFSAGTGTRYKVDSCYRSPYGYPVLLATQQGLALDYQACSGATTADVSANQLGTLSGDTDYVTMTIGGNDVGFADVITECALPGWISNCTGAINAGYTILNTQLPTRYSTLFATIGDKAPNATIIVGGYPRLFNGRDCNWATFFSGTEMSKLNKATDDLDALIKTRTEAAGFTYVDPRAPFVGHAVCDSAEWINGLSIPIEESYHPNRSGNLAYRDVFSPAMVAPTGALVGSGAASGKGKKGQQEATSVSKTSTAGSPVNGPGSATLQAEMSLRQQADHVLAMGLDTQANLAKAEAAGVAPGAVVSATNKLRSRNLRVVQAGLTELQALDAAHSS